MKHHQAHGATSKKRSGYWRVTLFSTIFASVSVGLSKVAHAAEFDSTNLQNLTDGLAWFALWMCLIGVMISSSLWAMGSKGQNPGQELTGKRGLIVCLTAAFFIGATPSMVNWLQTTANSIDSNGVSYNSPASLNEMNEGISGDNCQVDVGFNQPC